MLNGVGDIQGRDVEVAYFTCAAQSFGNIQVPIHFPYFRLETAKFYIRDKRPFWGSRMAAGEICDDYCKRIFRDVSNGMSVGAKSGGRRHLP